MFALSYHFVKMVAIAFLSSILLQPIHCQEQQAAKIDAFLSALNKFTEKYGGDGQSSQQQASQSSLAVSVPALMDGSVTGSSLKDLAKTDESQEKHVGPTSLEEFELQAFGKLAAKAKAKNKGMKRPAAAASATVPNQKAAPKAKGKKATTVGSKNGWKPACGVFGCLRCRGNINGCDTCWSPMFNGKRFSSRKEWATFMAQKAVQNKKKKCQKKK